jgi:hypothetical protein
MTKCGLKVAIAEARRFLVAAEKAVSTFPEQELMWGNQYTAAAKRSSMDLTRALAVIRRTH